MASSVIGQKYQISKRIGGGSFGEIFLGVGPNNETVAVKFERQMVKCPQLRHEYKVYRELANCYGFCSVYYFGTQEKFNVMVMDLLGPSLEDLFTKCNRKLSLKTVLQIADQILDRVDTLHSRHLIHCDIKPANFCVGIGDQSVNIYCVDFGLSKRYRNPTTLQHIPYREGRSLTGTPRYASINNHLGVEQSRRDDLESIGYILIYFLKGSLPWQGLKAKNAKRKYSLILEKKQQVSIASLCQGLPQAFTDYLAYCRSLRFDAKPDITYLRKLFRELYVTQGCANIGKRWDWDHLDTDSMTVLGDENKDLGHEEIQVNGGLHHHHHHILDKDKNNMGIIDMNGGVHIVGGTYHRPTTAAAIGNPREIINLTGEDEEEDGEGGGVRKLGGISSMNPSGGYGTIQHSQSSRNMDTGGGKLFMNNSSSSGGGIGNGHGVAGGVGGGEMPIHHHPHSYDDLNQRLLRSQPMNASEARLTDSQALTSTYGGILHTQTSTTALSEYGTNVTMQYTQQSSQPSTSSLLAQKRPYTTSSSSQSHFLSQSQGPLNGMYISTGIPIGYNSGTQQSSDYMPALPSPQGVSKKAHSNSYHTDSYEDVIQSNGTRTLLRAKKSHLDESAAIVPSKGLMSYTNPIVGVVPSSSSSSSAAAAQQHLRPLSTSPLLPAITPSPSSSSRMMTRNQLQLQQQQQQQQVHQQSQQQQQHQHINGTLYQANSSSTSNGLINGIHDTSMSHRPMTADPYRLSSIPSTNMISNVTNTSSMGLLRSSTNQGTHTYGTLRTRPTTASSSIEKRNGSIGVVKSSHTTKNTSKGYRS